MWQRKQTLNLSLQFENTLFSLTKQTVKIPERKYQRISYVDAVTDTLDWVEHAEDE